MCHWKLRVRFKLQQFPVFLFLFFFYTNFTQNTKNGSNQKKAFEKFLKILFSFLYIKSYTISIVSSLAFYDSGLSRHLKLPQTETKRSGWVYLNASTPRTTLDQCNCTMECKKKSLKHHRNNHYGEYFLQLWSASSVPGVWNKLPKSPEVYQTWLILFKRHNRQAKEQLCFFLCD